MEPASTPDVASRYRRFAEAEAKHHSAVYAAWAAGVADDAETAALIESLPERERQPNLVFAACRMLEPALVAPDQAEIREGEYGRFREVLHSHFDEVRRITATHHTQTNEPARSAILLPAVDAIHRACGKPLALIEFGASAGLCLWPEIWDVNYVSRDGSALSRLVSPPLLGGAVGEFTVTVKEPQELPQSFPQIDWRVGVDVRPVNPLNAEDAEWLRLLVWPGQTERLARLDAALAAARTHQTLVIPRDITEAETLDEILALVPTDLHPVVAHSAVLAYLDQEDREAFNDRMLDAVASGRLSWVSNEGAGIVPAVSQALDRDEAFRAKLRKGAFVVASDGLPQYQADGHASWIL